MIDTEIEEGLADEGMISRTGRCWSPIRKGVRLFLTEGFLIEDFNLVAGPVGFAEEVEAGFQRGIVGEAADADAVGEFIPAVLFLKLGEHLLELDTVEWVVGWGWHGRRVAYCKRLDDSLDLCQRERWVRRGFLRVTLGLTSMWLRPSSTVNSISECFSKGGMNQDRLLS